MWGRGDSVRRFIDLGPDEAKDICLLSLSPGGSDASVVREFNVPLLHKSCP